MTTTVVALMRGINVGRAKRVAMADLRVLLASLGYTDVRTLLNSGNAVFTCAPAAARRAADDMRRAIERDLGVRCEVVTRTAPELVAAMDADPLRDIACDPARHLVGFLVGEPESVAVRAVEALDVAPDAIRIIGRHAYLWCPDGVLASSLTKHGWERLLGVTVTARNWSTVTKLADMASR